MVRPSDHAKSRWRQYTQVEYGVAEAWASGADLAVSEPGVASIGLDGEEVRYDENTHTALVRKEDVVVTVIEVQTAKPALRRAVDEVTDD